MSATRCLSWRSPIVHAFVVILAVAGQATWGAAIGRLELEKLDPEHLAGSFHHEGVTVRFEVVRAEGEARLTLRDGAGKEIVFAVSNAARATLRLYGGKSDTVMQDVGGEPADETTGDDSMVFELARSREYRILPYLSRELGRRGITGSSHPASLGLHLMAVAAAKHHRIRVPDLDAEDLPAPDGAGDPTAARTEAVAAATGLGPPPANCVWSRAALYGRTLNPKTICGPPGSQCFSQLVHAGSTAQNVDPCRDDCFGLCGPGCHHWSWVCNEMIGATASTTLADTGCIITPCLEHDRWCSECECGKNKSCTRCFAPIKTVFSDCHLQTQSCTDESICSPCSVMTRCSQLDVDHQCVWCKRENRAAPGGPNGPYDPATCHDFVWNPDNCGCDSVATCPQIRDMKGCGWCQSTVQVMAGTKKGPSGGLKCANWIWDFNKCPVPSFSSCSEIRGTDYGWCATTGMAGTTKGTNPNDKNQCKNWIRYADDCACTQVASCPDIVDTKCGWCTEINQAMPGDKNGAQTSCGSGNWYWDHEKCPCWTIKKCTQIKDRTTCGWCESTKEGMSGNESGPAAPQKCSQWIWRTSDCPQQ